MSRITLQQGSVSRYQPHCLIGSSQKRLAVKQLRVFITSSHWLSLSCVSCSNACRLQRSKSRSIIRSGRFVCWFWSCSLLLGISSLISTVVMSAERNMEPFCVHQGAMEWYRTLPGDCWGWLREHRTVRKYGSNNIDREIS